MITQPMEGASADARSEVDTRRPFRSVKEAVAVFGERILSGEAFSKRLEPPPPPPPKTRYTPRSPSYSASSSRLEKDEGLHIILTSVKKLEVELEETKQELMMLKKRGTETDIAVASLNAELHRNKAKLAEMETAKGGAFMKERQNSYLGSDRWAVGQRKEEKEIMEEETDKYEYLPSLAAALRLRRAEEADCEDNVRRRVKIMKKKPIVPLIGDLFSMTKDSTKRGNSFHNKSYFIDTI